MRLSFLYTITILSFLACTQNSNSGLQQGAGNAARDSVTVVNDPTNNLNIQTKSFSEIDSSGVLMFPLSMGESEGDGGSLAYKKMPGNNYWNIIFLNSNTNEYHLLSDKKMLISDYNATPSSGRTVDIRVGQQYIFYLVITDDFNKDNMLTDADPTYLYFSDKEGNNFRQVSPTGYDIQHWQYLKSANKVMMTVKNDSDKNGTFDDKDEVTSFETGIENQTAAREVFSPSFKNKLKVLYDRDWKRLKK